MSHKYNDIYIDFKGENACNILRNLREDLEEILSNEFHNKAPDFYFLKIDEEQKNYLVVSYVIQNKKGEILKDPKDIVQHYFKQQGINLVSKKEWGETPDVLEKHSFDNNVKDVKPFELEEAIKNTVDGIYWVINEYSKDNPDMRVIMPRPSYGETFVDLEDEVNWGKKYPHMRSISTLIENKASVEEVLHNVKRYKQ